MRIVLIGFFCLFGWTQEKELPGAFFPESIAADFYGNLYVSSLASGEIVKFSHGSDVAESFVPVGVNNNSTGLFADPYRQVLWSCNVDLSMQTPSELRAFDLQTGNLVAAYPVPDFGLAADIVMTYPGHLRDRYTAFPGVAVDDTQSV